MECRDLINRLRSHSLRASNIVYFSSSLFCIFVLNYGKAVSRYDASVLNSIVMQSLFLKPLATEVRETEHAFDYLVFTGIIRIQATLHDVGKIHIDSLILKKPGKLTPRNLTRSKSMLSSALRSLAIMWGLPWRKKRVCRITSGGTAAGIPPVYRPNASLSKAEY